MTAHQPFLALASLAVVSLVIAAAPGPSIFLVMRLAVARGRTAGVLAALGTTAGCLAWCAASALGLAALLLAAPRLYGLLRVAGGLYLIFFAVQLWTARPSPPVGRPVKADFTSGAFWPAFIVCLTNPKSVLYFASIFAGYMAPGTPRWLRLAAIAVVVSECFAFYAAVAWLLSNDRAARLYARIQKPLDRVAGIMIGAFGLGLLLNVA